MRGRILAGVTGVVAASVTLVMSAAVVSADTTAGNFESPAYTLGDINGQDGWSKTNAAFDAAVVDSSGFGYAGFGGQSLRISNAVTSGTFHDQTFSKQVVDEAGESAAEDDGSSGPRQSVFDATWQFASTVPGAEQPGLSVVASPDRGDGARMSWIQMADSPSGLQVNFYDYQHSINPTCADDPAPDPFVLTPVAAGLDRSVPHTLRVVMTFLDGIANDVVDVYVDGSLAHTGTSWEDYFRDCELNPTRTVDSILFRVGGTAAPATVGAGFLIDNLSITTDTPAPSVVDDDGMGSAADCAATDTASTSIQASIDDAAAGTTITICPGTYTEQLSTDKDITLDGTSESGVVVNAPSVLTEGTISGQPSIVEVVNGATLTVNELTVAGPGASACGSLYYGILAVDDATIDATSITVSDVRDDPLSGCQNGRAIQAGRTALRPGHLIGDDLTIVGFQKNGIDTRGTGSSIVVTDSLIIGAGPTTAIAQNGVVIFDGASGTVSGTTISGFQCDHPSNCGADVDNLSQATGVLVLQAAGATISDNDISATDVGVLVDTSTAAVNVEGNSITSARRAGVFTSNAETTVDANAIMGNYIGVDLVAYPGATANSLSHVIGNEISGNVTGLRARDLDTGDAFVAALDAAVNRIVDNGAGAVEGPGGVVSAPDNWWGCQAGPNAGGCDTASSGVDLQGHWLVMKIARSTGTTTSTALITLDLTKNNANQNRSSVGHIPDGTEATFTTNKGVITSPVGTVDGKAVATLSTNGVTGKATVNGTIDNATLSTTVTLAKPKLSITAPASVPEGNAGSSPVDFTIKLNQPASVPVTVTYTTIDGTAKASAGDYDGVSGNVVIPAGTTTVVVPVDVNGDTLDEVNEAFTFKVTSATNATGTPSKSLRINDNDPTPSLSVADLTSIEGTIAGFTVSLSAASGQTVTVNYATSNGTATAADYQSASGKLTFLPGETSKQVLAPTHLDGKSENAETFRLTLSAPTLATIADNLGVATIPANAS